MRNEKVGGQWTETAVHGGLQGREDRSDQLIASGNVLMKCARWWKTLLVHRIDIAVVNSFVLFEEHRRGHPEVRELRRKSGCDQLAFRIELVQQLLQIDDTSSGTASPTQKLQHRPNVADKRRNCNMCNANRKVQQKTSIVCERCGV
ncbi:hypothetical protein HPB48_009195 [Haemaphysalis longicornis]|uniref:PiggyBac transposable element-derived protein domain-containing protein n=1 Tax=Haemaphysalis longicornis TaxID=44386 RepID=A0A9J6FES7_HAELO|nr:hypothetical protein HPB48_009195 [Haemaphysalis longicornis]